MTIPEIIESLNIISNHSRELIDEFNSRAIKDSDRSSLRTMCQGILDDAYSIRLKASSFKETPIGDNQ
jgi:hypothetical protein